ncbi:MAG: efflux RND transporter periplasmic adaptor subunit [Thermodesulfovibrionia bacterium]|nr:efflux RND transporter periplasmic adaptor subunit [Thermodesulfovibrionia bacterium]
MRKHISLIAICFLLFTFYSLLFFTGCKKKETKTVKEKTINVQVRSAEKKSVRPFIETVGTLNPYEEVIVSTEVDGILKEVNVDEGSAVSKDTILAVVNDTDYALEVQRAESALKQAEATLANTRLEYQRKENIYKEQLITQQQFDDVTTRLSLSEADVEKAKASLALAQQRLSKTKIYSSLPGFVKERRVSSGDYVRNGSGLFVIIQNNPLKLNFNVSEKNAGKLTKGQDVVFRVDAYHNKEFAGQVNIVYPSLEEKTRTLQVEAIVKNSSGMLKPGLFAHVKLYTGAEKDTILVPVVSILYEREITKVFTVEQDIAKEKVITTGQKYGEMIEIIDGLKENEQVVVAGQQNLLNGVKVNRVGSQ